MKTLNSLNEGIEVICNICKSLLDAQVEQMRNDIKHAEYCLKESKTMIEENRKDLEQCIERLIKEKANADQQNKARHNTGTGVTIGGAVVAAIPVIGWIPGEKSSLIHYTFYHHRNKCN